MPDKTITISASKLSRLLVELNRFVSGTNNRIDPGTASRICDRAGINDLDVVHAIQDADFDVTIK